MNYKLTEGKLEPATDPEYLSGLSDQLGFSLPPDYLDFLRQHNGGEGLVGEQYLVLFGSEELAEFNQEYEVQEYAPGIFLFGSNGGGEAFGFDLRSSGMPVVRIPFVGMDRRHANVVAGDFATFFANFGKSP